MLEIGHEVDRYVVEEQLGEGGMAVVYRVRHKTLRTRHALKVLTIASRDVKERLIQEGRVQATLNHNNIVGVSDVLDVAGSPGLLMEFIQGPALDHWLYHYQPSIEEALVLFRGIVAGVGHAHATGLIHRDLKPANVLLHLDDRGMHPKVTDFGLAKLTTHASLKRTRTGTTMGTPAYMAPEQIRDASTVDRRADLYSLGCILYELVCGTTPYQDDDIIELFAKVAAGDYPDPREARPDLPTPVVDAIEGLLETNRDFRVTDCQAVLEILDGADKASFTQSFALGQTELPDPRPMREPGETVLKVDTSATKAAKRFIRPVVTPVPPAPRDDLSGGSALAFGDDPGTTPLVLDGPDRRGPPVIRRWYTTLLFLSLVALAAFLVVGSLTGLGLIGIGLLPSASSDPADTVEPAPPEPTAPDPAPEPEPTPPEPVEPTPAEPDPVAPEPIAPRPVAPAPAPVERPSEPAPAPVEMAPEPETMASIALQGDPVKSLTFTDEAGGVFSHTQRIPPGRYDMAVTFPGEDDPVETGTVHLSAGPNPIDCAKDFTTCRKK